MQNTYSITLKNASCKATNLLLFQNAPFSWAPDAHVLVWMSKYVNPGTSYTFQWDVVFGMGWAQTGNLGPEASFTTSQTVDATQANIVTLDYNMAYRFTGLKSGGALSALYLTVDTNVPLSSSAAVGATMDGRPLYAVQARPGLMVTSFPYPAYCMGQGDLQQGDVLSDLQAVNQKPFTFPPGVYDLQAQLNDNNTWSAPVPAPMPN